MFWRLRVDLKPRRRGTECVKGLGGEVKLKNKIKIGHVLLHVKDLEALRDWYVSNLDLKIDHQFENQLVVLSTDGEANLVLERGEPIANPSQICLLFEVDNVDLKYQQLLDRKVTFKTEPMDQPYGQRTCLLNDLAGHSLEIYSPIQR
jgi:catechol 2,3-dioxygenase-like lactoylglutathione lyase family enzyme